MGIFESEVKEQRMVHFDYPNGDTGIELLDIVGASVYKGGGSVYNLGWPDFIRNRYYFYGYGKLPAGWVMPASYRHFITELHDVLDEAQRPPDDIDSIDHPYLSALAEDRILEIDIEPIKDSGMWDKIAWFLGATLILEVLMWGIRYATL